MRRQQELQSVSRRSRKSTGSSRNMKWSSNSISRSGGGDHSTTGHTVATIDCSKEEEVTTATATESSHTLRTRWKVRHRQRRQQQHQEQKQKWPSLLLLRNGKVQFVTVALMAAIFLLCLARAPLLIDAQLAWSPIQVDSESK